MVQESRPPAEKFRPMRRFRQQLSREECLAVLAAEKRGVLAVLGDGGYPYAVPLDFWYDAENDRLCFHGAKTGHKLDALARCGKASCRHTTGSTSGSNAATFSKSIGRMVAHSAQGGRASVKVSKASARPHVR